ncbi:MAG: prohibitin family protein [Oscillospiraceae bacterium]|jgi:regulator of protease activity HflC (stomatin/prohibitin superfamily)|nr:prohibitin family protein [Oscillospiraceae bacterium]
MTYPAKKPAPSKRTITFAAIGAILLGLIILFFVFAPYAVVPAGHSGVVVTMGRVSDRVLADGLHFKLPWQNVVLIDNRAQKASIETQAFSSDIQQVDVLCSINYSIDRATSQNLYQQVGVNYYDTVMLPRIMENVKAVFSKYSAEALLSARQTLSTQVRDLLAPELKAYGIEVLSIAIENVDFTDAFTDAVEAKQVAEQTKLRTQIEQDELMIVEKTTAERAVVSANADAEVARINADAEAYSVRIQAEAEAEANKMIAESVTRDLIDYVQANNWDGALPRITAGDGGVMPVVEGILE